VAVAFSDDDRDDPGRTEVDLVVRNAENAEALIDEETTLVTELRHAAQVVATGEAAIDSSLFLIGRNTNDLVENHAWNLRRVAGIIP